MSERPGPETLLRSYLVKMVVEILRVNAVIQVESPVREKEFVVRNWEISHTQYQIEAEA